MRQKGFTPLIILLFLVVVALMGLAYFAGSKNLLTNNAMLVSYSSPSPSPTSDPTAGWQTYTDTKNRFEFKYPDSLFLSSSSSYDYVYYLQTKNYKPYTEGSYQIQIEITPNTDGVPKVLPTIDVNTPEGSNTSKNEFVYINGTTGVETSYKDGLSKRYDMFSNDWLVDFYATGSDHTNLDQILSTFKFN